MASQPSGELVQFRWLVPHAGYHWVKGSEGHRRWLVRIPPERTPHSAITEPLRETPGLYLTFAELGSNEEEILAFANAHGSLGLAVASKLQSELPVIDGRRVAGELGKDWVRAVGLMRFACKLSKAINREDRGTLRKWIAEARMEGPFADHGVACEVNGFWRRVTPSSPEAALLQRGDVLRAARVLVQHVANEQLDAHTSARVLMDEETGRQGLYVNPKNLLGALWVQLSDAIDKGRQSKRCATCGEWIVITPGTSRSSREFCSDRCRVNAYRERKRSATRLHRRGVTPSAIAKQVGSDTKTVRGWLDSTKKSR